MRRIPCLLAVGGILLALTGCDVTLDTGGGGGCYSHYTMALSPDGRTLAVTAPDPKSEHLFLLDIQSHAVRRLTDVDCDGYPAWSPDGKSIALIHDDHEIHVVTVATGERRTVEGSRSARDSINWLTAHTLIFGLSEKNGVVGERTFKVSELPVAGGKRTNPIPHALWPALSPARTRIAYVSDSNDDLYIAAFPAGTPHLLLHDKYITSPAWSPDGRWIAYARDGIVGVVTTSGRRSPVIWTRNSFHPIWTSDSRHLLSITDGTVYESDIDGDNRRLVANLGTLYTKVPIAKSK